jgi:hypothetical protein
MPKLYDLQILKSSRTIDIKSPRTESCRKCAKVLIDKYRESWQAYSEHQRKSICKRLGLTYTNSDDNNLLIEICSLQQTEYNKVIDARINPLQSQPFQSVALAVA